MVVCKSLQVVADRKMRAKCGEDSNKQLSPVSVLEETETESSEDDDYDGIVNPTSNFMLCEQNQ